MSSHLCLLCLLLDCQRWAVPVDEDLESNDGIDDTAANVGHDDDIVPGLLDAGEDSGDGSETEQETGDSWELAGVTIAEVGDDLNHFTWQ